VISQPTETTTFAARQLRSAAAFAVAALLVGLLILFAIESMVDRRSRPHDRGLQLAFEDLMLGRRNGFHDELDGSEKAGSYRRRAENV
jgi:hypothetical protein